MSIWRGVGVGESAWGGATKLRFIVLFSKIMCNFAEANSFWRQNTVE